MARATWATKAQLLARLRPHALPGIPGTAPTELLPDVCKFLRGLTPPELRLVLAAYAGHPPDSPALHLVATSQHAAVAKKAPTRLPDVIVQLLVGGSRLGSASQLIDAADTIAKYASCDCQAGTEFWTVFAERAARLSASNTLDAQQLSGILAACAGWEKRCGGARDGRRSGGAWGHMLRSVGGRLADPQLLDTLSLQDVVAVARHAAHCEEPQLRLAASIGFRVGHEADVVPRTDAQGHMEKALTPEDLIDLIGAAGKLGGRLHMMTRSLADRLEPQAMFLPDASLVRLCSHLGSLEMFPQHLMQAMEEILPGRVPTLSPKDLLRLLRTAGRLRWRVPAVLGPLVESLRSEVTNNASFDGSVLASVVYELYRLDLWDEAITQAACERLGSIEIRSLTWKATSNILLALTYFSFPTPDLYRQLLQELLRAKDLAPEAIFQLKTVEMAIRVGHCPVSFKDLGQIASKWLFGIRGASTVPEAAGESEFAKDISSVAQSICWTHQSEVEVGPYVLDFAAVTGPDHEEGRAPPGWDDQKPGRSLVRCCVALEADGPSR